MRFRAGIVAAALAGLPAAAQEAPPPFPEFEAKRVRPPVPGSGPRITVQIDPAEVPRAAVRPPAESAEATDAPAGSYGWFWDRVEAAEESLGPGRLDLALAALTQGSVSAPRLQLLQEIVSQRGAGILSSTIGTEVSPALALAVIAVESHGRPDAVSSAGAQGLMQLMPDTAARFGVADALAPGDNIKGGVAYLDWLMAEFGGDPLLVLAGYNAGEGAVRSHDGVPPFAETRDYVPKVLAAYQAASGLCVTPPLLLSDGCVFQGMK
jgi:soluble lytic murein transglycosylase-like protein